MKTTIISLCMLISGHLCSQELLLKLVNPQIEGNIVTYDVTVDSLHQLLTMQYGIKYDPALLSYRSTKGFVLPGMSITNFNVPTPGMLLSVWFEPSVTPVTLPHGTVIYQVEFDMLDDNTGDVCFSDEWLAYEFSGGVSGDEHIEIFSVVDDCNPNGHQIPITTATEDVATALGLQVASFIRQHQISFTTLSEMKLAIQLHDINGNVAAQFGEQLYPAGSHTLSLNSPIPTGLYFFTTIIAGQPVSIKLVNP